MNNDFFILILIICSGVIEDQYGYRACKMPCGGIAYLMNVIYEYLDNNTDLVFCFPLEL